MTEPTAATLIGQAQAAMARTDPAAAVAPATEAVAVARPGRDRIVCGRVLGEALQASGDRMAARAAFVTALAEAEVALPADDVELMLLHNDLGITAKFTGEVAAAAEHYGRALDLLQSRGGDDMMLAALHHNLGGLAHTRGEFPEAERHTRAALAIHEGQEEFGALSDRGQLGSILSELGRHEEAIDLLRAVADEFGRLLGPDHVEVAIATTTLGSALHRAGRLDLAAGAYESGLAARERALGADHPELAPTLLNLGQLAADRGDPDAAAGYARRAVGVLDGRVVADHPFLRLARERATR